MTVVSSGAQGSWAWVGVRLQPAPAAADNGGFADLPEERRRAEAAAREQVWLSEQWTWPGQRRIEVRYWNDPAERLVSCTLLGQVYAPDPAAAERAAQALRARLLQPPRHVRAEELDDAGVRAALTPFAPPSDGGGLAEVRKRLAWAPSTRHDARQRVGVAVFPLAAGAVSWEPVWDALARQERRTLIGVCLEPYRATEGLRARLAYLAQEYGRLAVAGTPNPVYQLPVPPDPFAVQAAPLFQEAARRCSGQLHRLRITVAADGPEAPAHLAELLADAVSAPGAEGRAVVRVPHGDEAATAWGNVQAVGRAWLERAYGQEVPAGRLGEVERVLSDLVDLPQAAAAFRFPYEIPGRPPLFDISGRSGAAPAPGLPTDPRPGLVGQADGNFPPV